MSESAQDVMAELAAAMESECSARRAVAEARARQVSALKALKDEGTSMDRIAHRLLRLSGRTPTLRARGRLAATLRQKLSRAGVTRSHVVQSAVGSATAVGNVLLASPTEETPAMPTPKLIKRTTTTTEEFAGECDEAENLGEMSVEEGEERKDEEDEDEQGADLPGTGAHGSRRPR